MNKDLTPEKLLSMTREERRGLYAFDLAGSAGVNALSDASYGSREECEECTGCKYCSDCTRCAECFYCTKCANCKYCNGCKFCSDCTGSRDCTDCMRCTDCVRCINCERCSGCTSCSYCRDCMGIINGLNLRYIAYGVQLTEAQWIELKR